VKLNDFQGLARFGIVGLLATAIHVAVFSLSVEKFHITPVMATFPAFLIAMLASYRLNQTWTFGVVGSHRSYLPKYTLVATIGLSLNVAITFIFVNILGHGYGIALVAAIVTVPVVTYLLNRYWIFNVAPDAT